jgi:hypothetical protein
MIVVRVILAFFLVIVFISPTGFLKTTNRIIIHLLQQLLFLFAGFYMFGLMYLLDFFICLTLGVIISSKLDKYIKQNTA